MESEALEPICLHDETRAELSKKDGSILLSAGLMFVTADMAAWDKIGRESSSVNREWGRLSEDNLRFPHRDYRKPNEQS